MTGRVYVSTGQRYSWTKTGNLSRVGHSGRLLKGPLTYETPGPFPRRISHFLTPDFLAVEAAAHLLLADCRVRNVKEFDCSHEHAVAAVTKALQMVANGWRPPVVMTEKEVLAELERRMK